MSPTTRCWGHLSQVDTRLTENARQATVAGDGTLAYLDVRSPWQLVWRNRHGQKTGEVGQQQDRMRSPTLSPDERFVAVSAKQGSRQDLLVLDTVRGVPHKVDSSVGTHMLPVWSPSGEEVAYTVRREGDTDILVRRADGRGGRRCSWEEGRSLTGPVTGSISCAKYPIRLGVTFGIWSAKETVAGSRIPSCRRKLVGSTY